MNLLVLGLLGLLLLVSVASANPFMDLVMQEWSTFKSTHRKLYEDPLEDKFRMKIYMENKAKVARHNAKAVQGQFNYHLKMNKYGDMLHHEFATTMNGFKMTHANVSIPHDMGATFLMPANVEKLPHNVDWRKQGAVTPVKDQGHCGSCWAFSTTGALEAQHFRKTGVLTSLSEQNLVDCSWSYGNHGCNGGMMDNAFLYIRDNGGIDTEESYQYEGNDDLCRYNSRNKGAWDVGFVDIPQGDETALKFAIAIFGPVSIAIDAGHPSLQFYSHGIYREEECSEENLNHAVLAVGYGVDHETGQAYWLVKNSWGTSWGDGGYLKIARNQDNMCGVATIASFPLV